MGNLLFSPNGRIGPDEFVKGIMILALISAVITIIPMFSYSLGTMLGLVSIVLLFPLFCLLIKRSHDAGKSGWMSIVWFIIYLIIIGVISYIAQKLTMGDLGTQMEEASRAAAEEGGYDLDAILTMNDLVRTDNCFFAATGISTGALLKGVTFDGEHITTQSLVVRSRSGTVRIIDAQHSIHKLSAIAGPI